jgi:hypothetical protein
MEAVATAIGDTRWPGASPPAQSTSRLAACLFFIGGCLLGCPLYLPVRFGDVAVFGPIAALLLVVTAWATGRRIALSAGLRDPVARFLMLFALWVLLILGAELRGGALGIVARAAHAGSTGVAIVSNLKTLYVMSFACVGLMLWNSQGAGLAYVLKGFKWVNVPVVALVLILFVRDGLLRWWDPATTRLVVGRQLEYAGWPGNYPGLLAICFAVALAEAFAARGREWWVELIVAPWLVLTIFLSLSRTGWVVAIAVVLVLFALMVAAGRWRSAGGRRALCVVAVSAGLVAVFLVAQPRLRSEAADRLWDYHARVAAYGVPNERLNYWRDALVSEMSPPAAEQTGTTAGKQQRPESSVLADLSTGTGGVGVNYVIGGSGQLHSEYVDLVFRYGVIGLLLMLPVLILQCVRSWGLALRSVRGAAMEPRGDAVAVAMISCGALVFGTVQELIREPIYGPLLMLLTGFTVGSMTVARRTPGAKRANCSSG